MSKNVLTELRDEYASSWPRTIINILLAIGIAVSLSWLGYLIGWNDKPSIYSVGVIFFGVLVLVLFAIFIKLKYPKYR